MDYMEAVKKLEEKLVSNQKQDHESLVNGKCNGEVISRRIIVLWYVFLSDSFIFKLTSTMLPNISKYIACLLVWGSNNLILLIIYLSLNIFILICLLLFTNIMFLVIIEKGLQISTIVLWVTSLQESRNEVPPN